MLGIEDLVGECADNAQLHREIGRKHLSTTSWYHQLWQETQGHLGDLGRRLLDLIIRYITERSKREEIAEQARNIGREHGEMLAEPWWCIHGPALFASRARIWMAVVSVMVWLPQQP